MAKSIDVKIKGSADFGDAAREIRSDFERITQNVNRAMDGVDTGIKGKLRNITADLRGLKDDLVDPFKSAADKIPAEFDGINNDIASEFNGITSKIAGEFEGVERKIVSEFSGVGPKIEQEFDGIDLRGRLRRIGSNLSGIKDDIVAPFRRAADDIPDQFDGVADDVAGKFSGISDAIGGKLAGLGGLALGAGLGVAVATGFGEALERGALNDKLAAQLNLTAEESERVGNLSGALYADAYGESIGEVNDAIRGVVSEITDLGTTSDAEISKITAAALDLSTAFDQDINTVVKASGQLIKNGLAKDGQEAMDILAVGLQEAGVQGDDLLDTLNEYAPAFERMGFDGAQATALINAGLDAGVFNSDKLGDAINEFSIRAIDGSKNSQNALAGVTEALGLSTDKAADFANAIAEGGEDANKAFFDILDGLRAIQDPLERDAAGVALFGSLWEDLGEEAVLGLSVAQDAMTDTEGAAERLGETLNDNLRTKLEGIKRRGLGALVSVLENVVIPAFEKLEPIVAPAAEAIGQFFNAFRTGFTENEGTGVERFALMVRDVLIPAFDRARAMASVFWGALTGSEGGFDFAGTMGNIQDFAHTIRNDVLPALAAFAELMADAFTHIAPDLKRIFGQVGTIVSETLGFVARFISKTLKAIREDWAENGDTYIAIAKRVWEFIADVISAALKTIEGVIKIVTGIIEGDWSRVWEGIKQVVSATWDTITAVISLAVDGLAALIGLGLEKIKGWWSDTWAGLKTGAREDWDEIKTVVSTKAGEVVGFVRDLPGKIAEAGRGMWDSLTNGLADVVRLAKIEINKLITALNNIPGVQISRFGQAGSGRNFGSQPRTSSQNRTSSVRRFATGGVVDEPELIIAGDNPGAATDKEIISPQSLMEKTLFSALQKAGFGRSQRAGVTIQNLNVTDGRPIFRELDELHALMAATG